MSLVSRRASLAVSFLAIVLLFQNCDKGFGAQSLLSDVDTQTNLAPASSAPTIAPTVKPTATPVSTALVSTALVTDFYLGRTAGIDHLQFNSQTATVTTLSSSAFAGGVVGWMKNDASTNTVFVADGSSGNTLEVFNRSSVDGSLTMAKTFAYAGAVVNLALTKIGAEFDFFGASYDNGALTFGKLSADLSTYSTAQTITYAAGAHTHTSAFDDSRQLLFVANLSLNTIMIYHLAAGQLTSVGTVAVPNARTLVYNSTFDKLFVATESYSGPSYIYSFAIAVSGASFTLTNVGSLAMPMSGAELRVNVPARYVLATARNAGQESISAMPITEDGQLDTSRQSFTIPLSIAVPRSLEVTDDGKYALVATNTTDGTPQTVNIFSLTFDSNLNFVSSALIYNQSPGTSTYLSTMAIAR